MPTSPWPHDKSGPPGSLHVTSMVRISSGNRFYLREDSSSPSSFGPHDSISRVPTSKKWKGVGSVKELPYSLPAAKLVQGEIDVSMILEPSSPSSVVAEAQTVLKEVRTQIPPEMFDVSKLVCGTYVDPRLLVLRGVNGSALLFTRSVSSI
ncbi:hypothetical protein AXF42_Ash005600 [Apostasia shenzhenica]|uniref:Uncharacterized protein n=1 Tax=Apostasia shenzhenica TaxID=1088818 RepID=A0A2I0BBT4_9ASPA|nr:hypothetical protein AXF42_Ash005600 [Apostasia shenzhenica]